MHRFESWKTLSYAICDQKEASFYDEGNGWLLCHSLYISFSGTFFKANLEFIRQKIVLCMEILILVLEKRHVCLVGKILNRIW